MIKNFRVLSWGFAVTFVLALTMGSAGIALLLIRQRTHCQPVRPLKESPEEDESLELVPHITLNPSFNIDMLEHLAADVNESRCISLMIAGDLRLTILF